MGWTMLSIILLLIALISIIRIPSIQNRLTQKVITLLEEKVKTDVSLASIYISFPTDIILKNLYVEDQQRDTLLFTASLKIDTDLWKLIQKKIELKEVDLNHCKMNLNRATSDSLFNYEYIVKAFSSKETVPSTDTTTNTWKFSIKEINLSAINFNYNDYYKGNEAHLKLGELSLNMDVFDLENSAFKIKSISLKDTQSNITINTKDTLQTSPDTTQLILPFTIDVKNILLQNVKFRYSHIQSKEIMNFDIHEFLLDTKKIDLKNKFIDINKLELNKSFISLLSNNEKQNINKSIKDTSAFQGLNIPWEIKLEKLILTDNGFQHYNFSIPDTATAQEC